MFMETFLIILSLSNLVSKSDTINRVSMDMSLVEDIKVVTTVRRATRGIMDTIPRTATKRATLVIITELKRRDITATQEDTTRDTRAEVRYN
jgi:hypothetical protein